MSGVAGGDRIEAPHVRPTTDNYVSSVLSKFPGFTSADISGSFNYGNREDFGDIDLIVHIKGDDKKSIKQQLANYFASLPDSTIVPFKSPKYKGRKYYNAGELVSVLFPQSSYSDKTVQIDNIVAILKNNRWIMEDNPRVQTVLQDRFNNMKQSHNKNIYNKAKIWDYELFTR